MSKPSPEFMALIADVKNSRNGVYVARMAVLREWFEEKLKWVLLARSNSYGFRNVLLPEAWTVYDATIFKKLVNEYTPLLTAAGFTVSGTGDVNNSSYDFKISWDPANDDISH